MSDRYASPPVTSRSRRRLNALELGPRRQATVQDPLVHHGHHFGRTIHSFCNLQTLLTNGIVFLGDGGETPEENFTAVERREHVVFLELLKIIPGFENRLMESTEGDVMHFAELIQRGANGARSDDTKGIKSAIIDWITPNGQSLHPPLPRNSKIACGFHHEQTGALLCPAGIDWSNIEIKEKLRDGLLLVSGDQWPIMLYKNYQYDPEDPWNGLFRSSLLINAFKHVFTSPSSVDREPKATRSGNARIHGMRSVTKASIAYIATQVRFALTSTAVFSRTDLVTDSERFYNTIIELLMDPDEADEVDQLLTWWNRQVFTAYISPECPPSQDSALARIRERRARARAGVAP